MKVVKEILAAALATALSSGSVTAYAQDANSIDGKWTVKFTNKAGNSYEAWLELKGASGQYQLSPHPQRGKSDPCDKVAAPVSVGRSGEELVVIVKYSEALRGCSDRTIKLKKINEQTLEGAFGNGTPVSVTKN